MKTCFKCRETKPLTDFYKHPQTGDGYLNKCKECAKRDSRGANRNERKARAEYERKRSQDPKRKAKVAEYRKKRRAANPDKYKAHLAVGNAVRGKRLTKLPCSVCGAKKVEAHHTDYSKPLEVVWLCRVHHLELHNKESYQLLGPF